MTSMFQQALAMAQQLPSRYVAPAAAVDADDDVALGWESANPALQFERWEPGLPAASLVLSSKS